MGVKKLYRAYQAPKFNTTKVLIFLCLGIIQGCIIGFVFMGTSHAIISASKGSGRTSVVHPTSTKLGRSGASSDVTYHTLCTSNGSPYQNYQLRIAYSTYKLMQKMPGGERHVGFTRILHRTVPDNMMNEVPTFRADPLQPQCDDWCEYPVSDRGNAVRQFFDAAAKDPSMIKAPWIYMIESDYVFMKPLQPPEPDTPSSYAFAYPFDYINPKAHPSAMKKLYPDNPGSVADIPNTGPAPVLMRTEDWIRVTPEWEARAAVIEADEELKKELGWVREMYGFSVALIHMGIKVDLSPIQHNRFIAQPPMEDSLGQAHAYHYTQCTIYKTLADDKDVWGYDKRFFTSAEVVVHTPLIPEPPPFQPGKWKFVEGDPVTERKYNNILAMVRQMNRGIATLKDLN